MSSNNNTAVNILEEDDNGETPAPLKSLYKNSYLVYSISTIRSLVRRHHVEDLTNATTERSQDLVEFIQPELVITQGTSTNARSLTSTYLKHKIEFESVLKFLQLNRNFISQDLELRPEKDRKKSPDDFDKLCEETYLEVYCKKYDVEIIEFDDEYPTSELVFSIIMNRTEKRFVCVFRGSYNLNDWKSNAKLSRASCDDVKEALGNNVGVHRGFSNYLFNDEWTTEDQPSKFDQIVEILKEIRSKTGPNGEDYKEYEVFVTGHSLGGALSQLLAAGLANKCEGNDFLPTPITAITYASPMAGTNSWLKKFQSLEKKGLLRHLRVSNSGDMVCVVPAFPAGLPFMGYTQTGVNIHVYEDGKADVGYRNTRSIPSAFEFSSPLAMHSLPTYSDRLFNDLNADFLDKSVEDFYKEYAGDCTK